MKKFNQNLVRASTQKRLGYVERRKDLDHGVRISEAKKEQERQRDASFNLANKFGPPMIQEFEKNQSRIEQATRQINSHQCASNFKIMQNQRKNASITKQADLAEYKAKYQVDYMNQLTERGKQQDIERRDTMAKLS